MTLSRPLLQALGVASATVFLRVVMAQPTDIPPIGIIDFYGLRTISEAEARKHLPWKEGDVLSWEQLESLDSGIATDLGVHDVAISGVCCDSSRLILYIGVAEVPVSGFHYRKAPTGESVLPDEIVASAEQFELALIEAALSGIAGDDHSEGHSLMEYAPARAIQDQFVLYAEQHPEILRRVLHESVSVQQRAIAAIVIAYTKDKAKIVADLMQAVRDPDEEVRNNAARALGIIARFANNNTEAGIVVQPEPFIDLLNSIDFGDRNKGLLVLLALTENRQPELLDRLQVKALPSLIEMCRWKSWGHAVMACLILQRIVGLPDQDEPDAREPTIEQAKKVLPP